MIIQIETLDIKTDDQDTIYYIVDKAKTIIIKSGTKQEKIQKAKERLNKLEKQPNKKYRILEYHNDEADNNRKPCKVLMEI